MKNYLIAGAIALSTTVSFAQEAVNLKKVNQVIKSVVEAEQTEVIQKLEVKIDERSNLSNVKRLKTGISLSATAKESVWSKNSSTVDAKADLKTLTSDAAHTKVQLAASLGSKTEAIPLYAYVASQALEDAYEDQNVDENEKALILLLEEAVMTTRLDQIPAQFERFVEIVKKMVSANPNQDPTWIEFVNSLKVDSKVHNFETTEVVMKTTTEVSVDFFDEKLLISDLALNITERGLKFSGKVATTTDTSYAEELLASIKNSLKTIEQENAETLASLKDMASGYVGMAEAIITGKDEE